jgi:hypothetical protein
MHLLLLLTLLVSTVNSQLSEYRFGENYSSSSTTSPPAGDFGDPTVFLLTRQICSTLYFQPVLQS